MRKVAVNVAAGKPGFPARWKERFDSNASPRFQCGLKAAGPESGRLKADLALAEALGDRDFLSQIVTNLLTNAIHHNKPAGEVCVATPSENGTAVLTVADHGPGIAPEDLPHVFERFYRADKSRARANGNSGLGLAIGKAIMEAHGGQMEVSSAPGAGATFTVRLRA